MLSRPCCPTRRLSADIAAEIRDSDVYQISSDRESSGQTADGTSSSSDRDVLVERVVGVRDDGWVLEYDLPSEATVRERASVWQFLVRVFKPVRGPMRLLNRPELEARVDGWLKLGGMTRAACGLLIFTWNAFRIECDPAFATPDGHSETQTVTESMERRAIHVTSPDRHGRPALIDQSSRRAFYGR